jgi:hypothetical protein
VVIEMSPVYGLAALTQARRTLRLSAESGEILLDDLFVFSGEPLEIEEAFVTWDAVSVDGAIARITGQQSELLLKVESPSEAVFNATALDDACRANGRQGCLTRLSVDLPMGTRRFILRIIPA